MRNKKKKKIGCKKESKINNKQYTVIECVSKSIVKIKNQRIYFNTKLNKSEVKV